MLAWSERASNGRQKTRNHGYDVIVGAESYLLITPITLIWKLVTLNRLKSAGADATSFFPLVGCLPATGLWRGFSKSQDAVQQIKERGAAIDRGDINQAINIVQQISGLHCRALVMVSSSIRLTAWLQNSSEAGLNQRDWCIKASHRDYLRSGYLHHRLPVMGCSILPW